MYLYVFVCTLLIPVSMIIIGNIYRKKPPRDRAGWSGYRTTMSRLNQDTWSYAHAYVGRLWLILGIVLAAVTVVVMIVLKRSKQYETASILLTFIQLGLMAATVIPTEIKLRKIFDCNGRRR